MPLKTSAVWSNFKKRRTDLSTMCPTVLPSLSAFRRRHSRCPSLRHRQLCSLSAPLLRPLCSLPPTDKASRPRCLLALYAITLYRGMRQVRFHWRWCLCIALCSASGRITTLSSAPPQLVAGRRRHKASQRRAANPPAATLPS